MRRGINSDYRPNQEKSSSNLQQTIHTMAKNHQRTSAENRNSTTATSFNLEEMISYIRRNPNVALGIHHQLAQAPFESSTPQTPKRILDSSDSDGVQIIKQQRVLSNGKQKDINQQNLQQQGAEQGQRRLPFEQLKRAVSSNLPCFLIEYDRADGLKNRPSDISAASEIEDHFKQQGISISFSLVGHIGNKLKLGVNNKESYATLISTDKWPILINNIKINVTKPKYIPDAFALVVRYVPLQYSDEYVKDEIVRNLQSAENVRRIQYRFQRRTNDFRFTVTDLREYNATLNLGRISIGNSFCTITPFLTGNRMTFCTRCWCLGHMRETCQLEHPRCRVCLENIIEGQTHDCSNVYRCAQCNGQHHSLSSECEKVSTYRAELKDQVNQALSSGKLQRLAPQERVQPYQFQVKQNEFPSLPPPLMPCAAPWNQVASQPSGTINTNGSEDTTKMLISINQNILDMKENTYRINEKLDNMNEKVNRTALDNELHHETIGSILLTISALITDYIGPITNKDKVPQLQNLYDNFKMVTSHFKTDYSERRKRNTSPPPHLMPSQPSKMTANTSNNESDQNMSK